MTKAKRSPFVQTFAALCLALFCLLTADSDVQAASANPPGQLTYQGFLTDGQGVPFGNTSPTNVSVVFRIYDASEAGGLKWSSEQTVTLDKGHFSVLLGEGSQHGSEPFSADLSNVFTGDSASDRYMEMQVGGVKITPRLRFLPAPYALLAKSANQLVGPDGNPVVSSQGLMVTGNAEAGTLNVTGSATNGTLKVNGAATAASLSVTGTAAADRFVGDGSGLTGLNANNITSGTFTGNGSGLTQLGGDGSRFTGLRAANLTGSIGDGLLSGNVAKKNSQNTFSQGNSFSQEVNFRKRPGAGINPSGASMTVGDLSGFSNPNDSAYNGIIEFSGIGWQSGKIAYVPHSILGFSKFVLSASNDGSLAGKRVDLLVGGAGEFQGTVSAIAFNQGSDERFKRIVGQTDSAQDLTTLRNIEITDYAFKDLKRYGSGKHKKVVAQQVEKIFPQAVSRSTGVVPDIMKSAELRSGWVTLATDLKVGERVRLIAGETEGVFQVLEVTPERFRSELSLEDSPVMVYGREVTDFRSVDYDAIAMLNVSATQELARRLESVEAREKRLSKLERDAARVERLEAEVERLKNQVSQLAKVNQELAQLKRLVTAMAHSQQGQSRTLVAIEAGTSTAAR